jgi:hypothetical protein
VFDRLPAERGEVLCEARSLREEFEAEHSRRFWKRLFGG